MTLQSTTIPRVVAQDIPPSVAGGQSARPPRRRRQSALAPERLFNLDLPPQADRAGLFRKIYSRGVPSLERMLGIDRINAVYAHGAQQVTSLDFITKCLEYLQIRPNVSAEDLSRIPRTGPIVVVSNHPFGAIDGLILGWVLQQARPDVKIMVNYLLHRIPQLRELFIFVDPFGGHDAAVKNLGPMRDSLRWVKNGGMLAAFPAGEVAHLTLKDRHVTDPQWNPTIAKIVRRTGAAVLPVFFTGHNGPLFQLLGMVHPKLRTAMLPRAVFDKRGQDIEMRIGSILPAKKLAEFETDEHLLAHLRRRTFLLQHRPTAAATRTKKLGNGKIVPAMQQPIDPPINPALLAAEVASLPAGQLLVEHDEYRVYHASARQIPHTMQEIGRLREITFRATGEGTGRSVDLDRFDRDYIQLFIWHPRLQQIVGAYRLGQTDVILPAQGKSGLYTSTLFDYQEKLLAQLGPALEMGRSFVRQEFQRSFAPLLLLWKGIGHYCVRNPRYKNLFGPVSISNTYQSVSRQLMVQFLKAHHLLNDLCSLVRPRNPFPEVRVSGCDAEYVRMMGKESDEISELVSELEPDQKGIPILLKQYLKMGAKMLSFNLDPDFSDVVDGLIVVDLTRTEPRVLERYMSKDGYASFMAHHARR
jgi:putative hemolysin